MTHIVPVTIVIPTLNEAKFVPRLLESIQRQTVHPKEVLVIDSGSEDGTAQIVRKQFPWARVIIHQTGPAHKRNLGGFMATGDLIIFLDADTYISPNFIAGVIDEFAKRRLGIACPWYVPLASTLPIHAVYGLFNFCFFSLQKILPSGAGSCIVVRRSVFAKSRGYDTSLRFDDIEMIRRLSRTGKFGILYKTVYVSDRRFRQYGVVRMALLYSVLSIFFSVGAFRAANSIRYEFGKYTKVK